MLISSCQNCPLILNREFSNGLKNEFEAVVADEPSVFEPLKLYCIGNHEVQYLIKFEKLNLRLVGLYCNTLIVGFMFSACLFVHTNGHTLGRYWLADLAVVAWRLAVGAFHCERG